MPCASSPHMRWSVRRRVMPVKIIRRLMYCVVCGRRVAETGAFGSHIPQMSLIRCHIHPHLLHIPSAVTCQDAHLDALE